MGQIGEGHLEKLTLLRGTKKIYGEWVQWVVVITRDMNPCRGERGRVKRR